MAAAVPDAVPSEGPPPSPEPSSLRSVGGRPLVYSSSIRVLRSTSTKSDHVLRPDAIISQTNLRHIPAVAQVEEESASDSARHIKIKIEEGVSVKVEEESFSVKIKEDPIKMEDVTSVKTEDGVSVKMEEDASVKMEESVSVKIKEDSIKTEDTAAPVKDDEDARVKA